MTRIYVDERSSSARRVTICAYELGLAPELVELDLAAGEHRTPDFLELNPNGQVPAMVDDDDGFALWESSAIAWYLAEQNPSTGFLPLDLKRRADQMRWMFWNACHVEPVVLAIAAERTKPPAKPEGAEARAAERRAELARYLPILDARLAGRPWLGDRCSLADVCVGVTLELAARVDVELAPYPHIAAWLGRLETRESWKRASTAA